MGEIGLNPQDESERLLELAVERHDRGDWVEAEGLYRRVLEAQPGDADVLHLLGTVNLQLGRNEAAAEFLRRAVELRPDYFDALSNLGIALRAAGNSGEAIEVFRRALGQRGDVAEIHFNLANALRDAGREEEGIAEYREAVRLKTGFGQALANLGEALRMRRELPEAIGVLRRAVGLLPGDFGARVSLGLALWAMGEMGEAVGVLQKATELRADSAEGWRHLGGALQVSHRLDEAIGAFRKALELHGDDAETWNNLGVAWWSVSDPVKAVEAFGRAVELEPDYQIAQSNRLYAINFLPGCAAGTLRAEHEKWAGRFAGAGGGSGRASGPRGDGGRIRVGYVSTDFNRNVVGRNILALLREHDRSRFEIFCYYNLVEGDSFTEKFRGYADHWHVIAGVGDEEAAEMIRRDEIDILVDLGLHMRGGRLQIFARKPAGVQATFAGYPGTTGLAAMDFRLTDVYLDPPGEHDGDYTEKSIRLARSFWCYDAEGMETSETPGVNALPALSNGGITFGCLATFLKINSAVLELWGRVLREVGNSRMIIQSPRGAHRRRLVERMGVEESRVEFVEARPRGEYFGTFHGIDLGLDTFPYNGHTSSLDSLWMGVPIVTLTGETAVSRAGFSQLSNLGLAGELVAREADRFVEIAVKWARDMESLAELRRTLRARMLVSPLMDGRGFARDVERALVEMLAARS